MRDLLFQSKIASPTLLWIAEIRWNISDRLILVGQFYLILRCKKILDSFLAPLFAFGELNIESALPYQTIS
jgi:hypothetical protein